MQAGEAEKVIRDRRGPITERVAPIMTGNDEGDQSGRQFNEQLLSLKKVTKNDMTVFL